MTTYRTGNHWGVTIVREGERTPEGHIIGADQLVAVVVNGDQALAERICALLNREEASDIVIAYPRTEGRGYPPAAERRCICMDPPPTITGKNQPATRPPGWACPRHGVVL